MIVSLKQTSDPSPPAITTAALELLSAPHARAEGVSTTTARRLMRIETADGTLFVPAPAYRCWRCDALMPVEREREPLCKVCEATTQLATTTTPDAPHESRIGAPPGPDAATPGPDFPKCTTRGCTL